MSTYDFEVLREPEKGRAGGIRLARVQIKHISTIEDMGDVDSCLITLMSGRHLVVNKPYADTIRLIASQ